jgi:hypothetical protein
VRRKSEGFTAEERAAMKERARELKAETRSSRAKGEGERELLAKIAEMPEPDRAKATRIHAIIKAAAPGLSPKTYTLGFSDAANLDDGAMLPTAFAVRELAAAAEARISGLVQRAAS